MIMIEATSEDKTLLQKMLARPLPKTEANDYAGKVVMKPWGYELQIFKNASCDLWLLCLKPGKSTSMHCHQRKQATFMPLSGEVSFGTLAGYRKLDTAITVASGTFHSQENNTDEDVFFLEYETPSEKTDLVRAFDRYGRQNLGYEGKSDMVPLTEFLRARNLPPQIYLMLERVA